MNDRKSALKPLFTWRSAIAMSRLPQKAKHVALTLSLHMSERGDSCFPGLRLLEAETSMGKSTVLRMLDELERSGFLEIKRGGGRGRPNHYGALIPIESYITAGEEVYVPPGRNVSPGVPPDTSQPDEETSHLEQTMSHLGGTEDVKREDVKLEDVQQLEQVQASLSTTDKGSSNLCDRAIAVDLEAIRGMVREWQGELLVNERIPRAELGPKWFHSNVSVVTKWIDQGTTLDQAKEHLRDGTIRGFRHAAEMDALFVRGSVPERDALDFFRAMRAGPDPIEEWDAKSFMNRMNG